MLIKNEEFLPRSQITRRGFLFPFFASSALIVFDLAVNSFFKACRAGARKARGRQPVVDRDVHSASLHAWWQTTQFCPKIATAWFRATNCQRQLVAHEIAA
jgi:hypothetical protein